MKGALKLDNPKKLAT